MGLGQDFSIVADDVVVAAAVRHLGHDLDYGDQVFIYQLEDGTGAFYCGSTVNPAARLLNHIGLHTKDTAVHVARLLDLGTLPVMRIVDVTTKADRLALEARWINQTPGVVNTVRYRDKYLAYRQCPTCHRAASTRTLDGPVPLPQRKLSQQRIADYLFREQEQGEDAARRADPEAWAWRMRQQVN